MPQFFDVYRGGLQAHADLRDTIDLTAVCVSPESHIRGLPLAYIPMLRGGQVAGSADGLFFLEAEVARDLIARGAQPVLLGEMTRGCMVVGVCRHDEWADDAAGGSVEHWRRIAPQLTVEEQAVALSATGLANWYAQSPYCARCGGKNRITSSGWSMTCQQCGAIEYPRQDPAIIVMVTDDDGNALLAHNALWQGRLISCLAGFVEAGEPLESAVVREVKEEVGVDITDITYVRSQPWPFPRSLMVGFTARVAGVRPQLHPDGVEIAWADFYSPGELDAAVSAGAVELPGEASLAAALLRRWRKNYADHAQTRRQ